MFAETTLKFLFALAIFVVIVLAGWYPFKRRFKDNQHIDFPIGETLATGIFLGAALLHMLPESTTLFQQRGFSYPFACIITGAVFLLFLWFEHLGKELYTKRKNSELGIGDNSAESCMQLPFSFQHNCNTSYRINSKPRDEQHQDNHSQTDGYAHLNQSTPSEATHPGFAILAWSMLSMHSLMLGAALGLNHSNSIIVMLFLAIITHKWAESFAIAVQLNKSTLSYGQCLIFFLSFSLMTPLGIYFGWYFGHGVETHSLFDPILIAASAGTFLYLGTLHGLERCVMVQRCCNLRDFSFVIIGFGLMAGVAAYV